VSLVQISILHRYILRQLLVNFAISLGVLVTLFVIFDFFDRIDNIVAERASIFLTIHYFFLKVPLMISFMLPVAVMIATLFTVGLLSKNSEITAMRVAGLRVRWIVSPILLFGIILSFIGLLFNEKVVPGAQRRVREIYNIDIRKKDQRGGYSQADFWWRYKDTFYSSRIFDSRTDTLLGFSSFKLNKNFQIIERVNADKVPYIDSILGWTMINVERYRFTPQTPVTPILQEFATLPLPMLKPPSDFYNMETDPHTMSYGELKTFILEQQRNGLATSGYLADLYEKISFPFVAAILPLIVIPFSLLPARKGNMAPAIMAALAISFSYYAIHSFSVALGRAELIAPMLSAWLANLLLGLIGSVLLCGTEAPR
jgi:lipopolysaccharide export system permease protein